MYTPIHSLETTILISKESQQSQSFTNLSNNSTITLNNTGNIERDLLATITLTDTFTLGFTITNLSNNRSIVIPSPVTNYPSGSIFLIYTDAVYLNNLNTEIAATFSGQFTIAEHLINNIKFTLPNSCHADATFSWIKSDDSKKELFFIEGFTVNENNSLQRKSGGISNKYAKGHNITSIDYDLNIDKMWLNSDFFDYDKDSRYQIVYQTDNSVSDIMQQTYYLNSCCFSGLSWTQSETDIIKEGIRANFVKIIKG